MNWRLYGAALLPVVTLTSCVEGIFGPPDSSFTAEATGAIDGNITGDASFIRGRDPERGQPIFFLAMYGRNEASTIINLAYRGATGLPEGEYEIGVSETPSLGNEITASFLRRLPEGSEYFGSTDGVLNVTSSSRRQIAGDFEINFRSRDGEGRTFRVTGRFLAVPRNVIVEADPTPEE